MFKFILLIIQFILRPATEQENLYRIGVLEKENSILRRKLDMQKKRVRFSRLDKLFFAVLMKLSDKVRFMFSIVQPKTVLKWYHSFLKKRWRFPAKNRTGRPPIPVDIRQLVLQIKNDNVNWGNKKIQGELFKLGISLAVKTIRNIITDFRRKGMVKESLSWKKFIQSHRDSIYAADFFTVDSLLGFRFYVFFIIYLKTREIVKFRVTSNPSRLFVQQQLMDWREDKEDEKVFLIHDNDQVFNMPHYFKAYGIKDVPISVNAPNMNCYAERFVRSIRREALDWFIIFSQKQLENILKEYISYYNSLRPHQGIGQEVPAGYQVQDAGEVVAFPVLYGLHHFYERRKSA